ncbi:hypothetical protein T01_15935, partial [Trichinella spiralis]
LKSFYQTKRQAEKDIFRLKITPLRVCAFSCSSTAYALPKYKHKLIFHVQPKHSFPLFGVNNNCAISKGSLPGSSSELSISESVCLKHCKNSKLPVLFG